MSIKGPQGGSDYACYDDMTGMRIKPQKVKPNKTMEIYHRQKDSGINTVHPHVQDSPSGSSAHYKRRS